MTCPDVLAAHRDAVATTFAVFRRTPREMLRFVTTVIYAAVVGLGDDVGPRVRDETDQYHAKRRAVLMEHGKISRNPHGQTRWAGVIELDLLHPWVVCSAMKQELLNVFGIDVGAVRSDQRILVIHEHAVIDFRGHVSVNVVLRDLRAAYPGPRRVHAATIYTEGTVQQQLKNLAGYVTKHVHRYSSAWEGTKTTYHSNYESKWRDFILNIYAAINYSRLLNTNLVVQSTSFKNLTEMHDDQRNPAGEVAAPNWLQLMAPEAPLTDEKHNLNASRQDATRPSQEAGENNVKAHEIIDNYFDLTKIPKDLYDEIVSALERSDPMPSTPDFMMAMYSPEHEKVELELEQLRAEVSQLQASAMRDRAEARRPR